MFKTIYNPDLYHGKNKHNNFFEGWYYKLVDSENNNIIAIIPGIFKGCNSQNSHSFIQILLGNDVKYYYIKFPSSAFTSNDKGFIVNIDKNEFSLQNIKLDINDNNISLKGTLSFSNLLKWPDSFLSPGSMGFYNYFSFMECYSQVTALLGVIHGQLVLNNKTINFSEGKLYIEKNWGKTFPYSWLWVQCNSFLNSSASITCSIGHVPMPIGSFRGFLVGFYFNEKLIKFTSLNRSSLKIQHTDSDVLISLRNKNYELSLKTYTEKNNFILCNGPTKNGMIPLVNETLQGKIEVILKSLKDETIIFKDTGYCAGVEYGGDMMKIVN